MWDIQLARYNISLIRGDGIGPEQADAAKQILETINDNSDTKFSIHEVEAGDSALVKSGKALPESTLEIIKKSQACLKGPVGESAADVIIVLRRMFDLFANIRPAKSYPNIPSIANNVDHLRWLGVQHGRKDSSGTQDYIRAGKQKDCRICI
jgi:3-isopropylmalate dehydrogenase